MEKPAEGWPPKVRQPQPRRDAFPHLEMMYPLLDEQ